MCTGGAPPPFPSDPERSTLYHVYRTELTKALVNNLKATPIIEWRKAQRAERELRKLRIKGSC